MNNAFVHLSYKLHNPNDRIGKLGVMSTEQVSKYILHNMYALEDVMLACHEAACDGLLDRVYVVCGQTFVETDYNKKPVLSEIANGTIFDEVTGNKFSIPEIELCWCLSQETLKRVPAESSHEMLRDKLTRWVHVLRS